MSTLNPSLGQLDRAPGEVRNKIYEMTSDSSSEEVDITEPCQARETIAKVSKQVNRESSSIVSALDKEPCRHHRFVSTIPIEWTDYMDDIQSYNSSHSLTSNGVTYRFLTTHLGDDVPLAVVVTFNGPTGSSVMFYGASAEHQTDEEKL